MSKPTKNSSSFNVLYHRYTAAFLNEALLKLQKKNYKTQTITQKWLNKYKDL